MQEKDLQEKLNQELEEMAPDILENILLKPRVPVKNKKELFGTKQPLFREKKKYKTKIWTMATAAVFVIALLLTAVITISNKSLIPQDTPKREVAYSIVIDVNPSITINVGDDGKVQELIAGNKDAKEIVSEINEKLDEGTSYKDVLSQVVRKLNKKKYFDKKESAMLVSIVSEDEGLVGKKCKSVKKYTNKVEKEKKIKCKTIYQQCVMTDEIKDVAKENKVSVGKAALCMKIAEKEHKSVKKLCGKKISTLVKKAEKTGIISSDATIDEYVYIPPEETDIPLETDENGETIELENPSDNEETESTEYGEMETPDENMTEDIENQSDDNPLAQ